LLTDNKYAGNFQNVLLGTCPPKRKEIMQKTENDIPLVKMAQSRFQIVVLLRKPKKKKKNAECRLFVREMIYHLLQSLPCYDEALVNKSIQLLSRGLDNRYIGHLCAILLY
jgi:hypothetical protein